MTISRFSSVKSCKKYSNGVSATTWLIVFGNTASSVGFRSSFSKRHARLHHSLTSSNLTCTSIASPVSWLFFLFLAADFLHLHHYICRYLPHPGQTATASEKISRTWIDIFFYHFTYPFDLWKVCWINCIIIALAICGNISKLLQWGHQKWPMYNLIAVQNDRV